MLSLLANRKGAEKTFYILAVAIIVIVLLLLGFWLIKWGGYETMKSIIGIGQQYQNASATIPQ